MSRRASRRPVTGLIAVREHPGSATVVLRQYSVWPYVVMLATVVVSMRLWTHLAEALLRLGSPTALSGDIHKVGGIIGWLLAVVASGVAGTFAQVIFIGRDVVTASPDALVVERWRLGRPVPSWRREYASSRILNVRSIGPDLAANKGFWHWTPNPYAPGVAFDYEGETVFVAPGLGGGQADRVVQALKRALSSAPAPASS